MRLAAVALPLLLLTACDSRRDGALDAAVDGTFTDVSSDTVLRDAGTDHLVMPACSETAGSFAPLATRCQHFVDPQGRVTLLHGINARVAGVFDVTFSDGRTALEPIPAFTRDDAARMRQLGFNLLRLPVNWSGIEPSETGGIDDNYVSRIAAAVDLARAAGMYVLIDFHQDAYSKEIGEDGAPLWAIQPPPAMLLQGPLDDLGARRGSSQVLAAFDTFFGDAAPGPSLRTRFAHMAAQIAARFAGDSAVLGYEMYNEPIALDDALLRFHTEVAAAIRAVDPNHLIAFEPDTLRNVTDRAALAASPAPWTGGVYAPHIYTLAFTGTDAQREGFTYATLRASNAAASREAASWGVPLLITEFGYDPNGIRAADWIAFELDAQDEFGASSVYWVWKENSQGAWGLYDHDAASDQWTERSGPRKALARVMPESIAGWPRWYRYDRTSKRFELEFEGSAEITSENRVYVPAAEDFASAYEVRCDGRVVTGLVRDDATGLLGIACNGDGVHDVVVQGM